MTIIRPNRPAPVGAEAVPDSHGLNLFRADPTLAALLPDEAERVDGDSYEYDGQRLPLTTRTERIEVRDGEDVEITVRSTGRAGPAAAHRARPLRRGPVAGRCTRSRLGGRPGPVRPGARQR